MPEELLDAQARERIMNIFAGGTIQQPTIRTGDHTMDAAPPTLENAGTPAPHGRHVTRVTVPETPVPEPVPEPKQEPKQELLSEMIEDCFIQNEVIRQHRGRDVTAYLWSSQRATDHGVPEQRFPIPDEDLIIIEKLYHGRFPDGGRKRGALMRYIKFFKDQLPEKTDFFSKLKRQIERHS